MAKFDNQKCSVAKAFKDYFYIIPDYQREYVWKEKEVQQLLDDIDEQFYSNSMSDAEYFVGTVLVSPIKCDNNDHCEVIDGQQRLTTFFLLLCALRHLLKEQGGPRQFINGLISTVLLDRNGEMRESLRLKPRYENAGEVMAKLVELDATPDEVRSGIQMAGIASFGSLEKLINAYDILYSHLKKNYDDINELKRYLSY